MDFPTLTQEQIDERLTQLPRWEQHGGNLVKTFHFATYTDGLVFAAAVGAIAEAHNHHPDILITWRKVSLTFTTHDAGSQITQYDIDAATAIEALGFPRS